MPRSPRPKKLNADDQPVPVKASNADIKRRVNTIYRMLAKGETRAEILRYASETWGVTERTAEEYLSRATSIFNEQASKDHERQYGLAMTRLTIVFGEALDASDYQGAIAAQREINKIIGLYAPVNQNVNVSGTLDVKAYKGISPDDWDEPTAKE